MIRAADESEHGRLCKSCLTPDQGVKTNRARNAMPGRPKSPITDMKAPCPRSWRSWQHSPGRRSYTAAYERILPPLFHQCAEAFQAVSVLFELPGSSEYLL